MSTTQEQIDSILKFKEQIIKADEDVLKFGEGFVRFTVDGCEHIPYHRVILSEEPTEPPLT